MSAPPNEAERAWIVRVLGIEPSPPAEGRDLIADLGRLGARLQQLRAASDPRFETLARAFAKAAAEAKAGSPGAGRLIDDLAAELDGKAPAAATRTGPDFGALKARWGKAQEAAAQSLTAIGEGLLGLEEVQRDPRFPHVQKAVRRLPDLLPPAEALATALDTTATGPAVAAVASYRQALAAAPALARLEALAARHVRAVPVLGPLGAALGEIETALAGTG